MAEELNNDDEKGKDNNENKHDEHGQYSLTISIIRNKLELHLHDTSTKYMYHGSYDSNELQTCGFHVKQAQNLENVCKFMESARKGHQQLQFEISIQQNENNQIENGNIGIIKIIKEDDFFPLEIIIKLKQTPRKKIDILEEHITDLQDENIKLKQQLQDEIKNHRMPKRSVIMWSGNRDNIPNGWMLCDGENGTPDLRNRFVIGASDDIKSNSNGGSDTHNHEIVVDGHQLTINEMPSHKHGSTKNVLYQYSGSRIVGHNGTVSQSAVKTTYNNLSGIIQETGGNQAHNHSARSTAKKELPPYYALCFIMKYI